jgi:predicted negative regulator of RcsB-dependent stress response
MIEITIFTIFILVVSWTGWQVYKSEKEFNESLDKYWKTYYALQETKLKINHALNKY